MTRPTEEISGGTSKALVDVVLQQMTRIKIKRFLNFSIGTTISLRPFDTKTTNISLSTILTPSVDT